MAPNKQTDKGASSVLCWP